MLPVLLNLVGVSFASSSAGLEAGSSALRGGSLQVMSGAFTHTILEWSAISIAFLTVPLAYVNTVVTRNPAVLLLGVALACAGVMDAFHILAADQLVTAVASGEDLLPFTWALSRGFNSLILVIGAVIVLQTRRSESHRPGWLLAGSSAAFFVAAGALIAYSLTATALPQTQFPGAYVTRPFDLAPLLLYVVAGLWLFPRYYEREPNLFSFALMVSMVPHIAAQLHMAFGSSTLYDNDFNVGHFLKIVAYAVPFGGLCLDYLRAHHERLAADRAKSEFLATMSHEMRTPLNAVIGMTDLLAETSLTAQQAEYVTQVSRSGEALLSVVDDVLDMSKIEADQLHIEAVPYDLGDILEHTLQIVALRAHQKSLELVSTVEDDVPVNLLGDPRLVQRVLLNLVGNAIKFTETGTVHVKASRGAGPHTGAGVVRIDVSDTGVGIPQNRLESIFDSFTQADTSITRRYGGTGLGLTISRRLVTMMGGEMFVSSEVGSGSVFSFTLPIVVSDAGRATFIPPGPEELVGRRVLVVDDTLENRTILTRILQAWGAQTVTEAAGGVQAIQILREAAQGGQPYDLMLLDGRMPEMDGVEVAESVNSAEGLSATVVMMLTSDDGAELRARAKPLVADFLVKPVRREDLARAIRAGLSEVDRRGGYEEPETDPRPGSVRVLVAEDVLTNWVVVESYLQGAGLFAIRAENGREALEAVMEDDYDLVLMDIGMPEMDGYAATRAIRKWEIEQGRRRMPIVALTAHSLREDLERAIEAGCDSYLTKPVRKQVLLEEIAKYVRGWGWAGPRKVEARHES